MGTDQIRSKPLGLELLSRPGTPLSTDDFGFRLHYQGVNPLGVATIEVVPEMVQRLRQRPAAIESVNPQGHQLVLTLLSQALNDVKVLAGKVLMDKEDLHQLTDVAMTLPCPGILPTAAAGRSPCAT